MWFALSLHLQLVDISHTWHCIASWASLLHCVVHFLPHIISAGCWYSVENIPHISYHCMSPHWNPTTLWTFFAPIAETVTPLFAWGCGGYLKRQLSLRTSHRSRILNKIPVSLNLFSQGDTSRLFVGDLMSLNGPIPVSLSLVPRIVLDILMICFACFAYCGRWNVKVWNKGKPKSGYLSVSVKQETTSLAHKIRRDPSSTHEK